MVLVVQTQAADIVAVFRGHGREQLLDSIDDGSDFRSKDRSIDQVCFNLLAVERVETNISAGVDQLTEMDSVVFVRNEADDVGCFGHFGRRC